MGRVNRLSTVLLLAALLLSACQPIQPPEKLLAPEPQQPRPDAPAYGVCGPYAVEVRDFVIVGTQEYSRSIYWLAFPVAV